MNKINTYYTRMQKIKLAMLSHWNDDGYCNKAGELIDRLEKELKTPVCGFPLHGKIA